MPKQPDLCENFLSRSQQKERGWGGDWECGECDDTFGHELYGAAALDPAGLDLEMFKLFKPEIKWAWIRAYRVGRDGYAQDASGPKAISDEFMRLMECQGGFCACALSSGASAD